MINTLNYENDANVKTTEKTTANQETIPLRFREMLVWAYLANEQFQLCDEC